MKISKSDKVMILQLIVEKTNQEYDAADRAFRKGDTRNGEAHKCNYNQFHELFRRVENAEEEE